MASSAETLRLDDILEAVTVRLFALMFAAFDTTALTLSQAILDLMTQDQSTYAETMRIEISSLVSQPSDRWTLNSLQSLTLLNRYEIFDTMTESFSKSIL
jgi:hypothetical protein